MCEIFIESIANRAMHAFHYSIFQVEFPAHLKLNAPSCPENAIKKFLALIGRHPYGAKFCRIFRVME